MKKYHKIMIEPVLNGILVSVGCQKAVYTDLKVLIRDFEEYLSDPDEMSKHYFDRSWSINDEVPRLRTEEPSDTMPQFLLRGGNAQSPRR